MTVVDARSRSHPRRNYGVVAVRLDGGDKLPVDGLMRPYALLRRHLLRCLSIYRSVPMRPPFLVEPLNRLRSSLY